MGLEGYYFFFFSLGPLVAIAILELERRTPGAWSAVHVTPCRGTFDELSPLPPGIRTLTVVLLKCQLGALANRKLRTTSGSDANGLFIHIRARCGPCGEYGRGLEEGPRKSVSSRMYICYVNTRRRERRTRSSSLACWVGNRAQLQQTKKREQSRDESHA